MAWFSRCPSTVMSSTPSSRSGASTTRAIFVAPCPRYAEFCVRADVHFPVDAVQPALVPLSSSRCVSYVPGGAERRAPTSRGDGAGANMPIPTRPVSAAPHTDFTPCREGRSATSSETSAQCKCPRRELRHVRLQVDATLGRHPTREAVGNGCPRSRARSIRDRYEIALSSHKRSVLVLCDNSPSHAGNVLEHIGAFSRHSIETTTSRSTTLTWCRQAAWQSIGKSFDAVVVHYTLVCSRAT